MESGEVKSGFEIEECSGSIVCCEKTMTMTMLSGILLRRKKLTMTMPKTPLKSSTDPTPSSI